MIPQISLIIPGIRPGRFQRVYDSFCQSWHGTFEIVFVCPCDLPKIITVPRGQIQWYRDFGCPSRAMQIGWVNAKADWFFFATDDCVFDSDAVNKAWRLLEKHKFDYKTVIVTPFTESDNWSKWMLTPFYYHAWWHANLRSLNIPFFTKIYMNGLISKQLMKETGGFDCKFESTAWAYNEFSVRSQALGARFVITNHRSNHCEWQPKATGDHGPVENACTLHDEPLFHGIYNAKNSIRNKAISPDNWKHTAERWPRRFPQ